LFVSLWSAGCEPELPDWREAKRDCAESLAAQPWTERDDGLIIHPREAAELGEPIAGQGRPLTTADSAEQMTAFRSSMCEQESEMGLSCLGRRLDLQGLIHQ
jgi:hypothetical protein